MLSVYFFLYSLILHNILDFSVEKYILEIGTHIISALPWQKNLCEVILQLEMDFWTYSNIMCFKGLKTTAIVILCSTFNQCVSITCMFMSLISDVIDICMFYPPCNIVFFRNGRHFIQHIWCMLLLFLKYKEISPIRIQINYGKISLSLFNHELAIYVNF